MWSPISLAGNAMNKHWTLCTVAALLLSNAPASADYWVSIGAFRAPESAAALAASAGESLPFRFATLAVGVSGEGTLHRVAAGPHETREEALRAAARIREAGYQDAWVLALDDGVQSVAVEMPAAMPTAQEIEPSADALSIDLSSDAWDAELPPIEVLLQDLPDVPPALPPPPVEPLQETDDQSGPTEMAPPDDYQLHKLHRDAALFMPPEPASRRFGDFDMRVKWFTSAQSLPAGDVLRQASGEATPMGHNADLRLMWRKDWGDLKVSLDHATTWLRNDLGRASPGLTFDQTPTDDRRRLMDLTWRLGDHGSGERLHRFDRLALEYRNERSRVTVGRQALSWGAGLVFNPMDLFNPFAPTTVDQDYKAGDDLLLIERLFNDGSDLQLLAVGRRSADGHADFDSSSVAAKYRAVAGENEVEFMASQHYSGQVYGVGLRIPAGGALVRSDVTWSIDRDEVTLSGLVNADYSFGFRGTIVHVFGEYFHNGFGVARLPPDLSRLPAPLIERIRRGELFNLMRNYLALGTTFRWHYLLNQSLALIANLHDNSFAAQASLAYDASDASRLQVGLTKPFGDRGDEFGGVTVGEGLTVGGGEQGFLRFVYFF